MLMFLDSKSNPFVRPVLVYGDKKEAIKNDCF
ncbi:hypothetical protein AsAng_0033100 [Aureispira anguillae]|uniref:Uncharacterized protein n=1 Tax=Aureispira anguillae TaxID=2864201 RepID=A0A915YG84_9BACT|nr:hypothetical protein AsAng_0033100 [Aureispira anguillae]